MKRQALCAVLLGFLVSAVFPSESRGSKTEPHFTVTISGNGVEENIQKVFSLGPSATLRVVDESNRAVFLPQPTTSDTGAAASYSFAYPLENGHCNFKKQVSYTDAFPGYSQPVWVRTVTQGNTGDNKLEGSVTNYTFTNPPAEYLNKAFSFCVRFATESEATTSTTSTTTTSATEATPTQSSASTGGSSDPQTESGGSASGSGGDGRSENGTGGNGKSSTGPKNPVKLTPHQDPDLKPHPEDTQPSQPQQPPQQSTQPKPPTSPPAAPRPDGEGAPGVHQDEDGADQEDGQDANTHPSNNSGSHHGGTGHGGQEQTHETKPDGAANGPNHSDQVLPHDQEPGGTPGLEPPKPAGGKVPSDTNKLKPPRPSETSASQDKPAPTRNLHSASVDAPSRMRRLSDGDASEVKYLTIVVHSAAWGFAARTLSLSAALLSVATTVLASK
ncbi:UNVERIFIED_CONTAM: Toxoplasma gondii family A protein [Hammondia hammondi]|eukprot:XP_008884387.1 Toxoplasma gondii family A protein [Hammondia hammondi]